MKDINQKWIDTAEYKDAPIITHSIENDRDVTGICSVFGNVDDGSDVTHNGAFRKTIAESSNRVRHLWNHDFMQPPIAAIKALREISVDELPIDIKQRFPTATGGLLVTRSYLDTPRGNEVLAGIKSGAINEMSFGFNPINVDYTRSDRKTIRNLREVRLLDTSDVSWGMNPATVARKGAIPYHETPKADPGTAWDGPAQVSKADPDTLKIICAWYDSSDPDVKSSYKLPHHMADGDHAVVWRGVAAAMGALLGAQGGVNIPESDKHAVYNHLSKHYEQFDKEPPDYKLAFIFDTANLARQFMNSNEFKEGRTFSAQNSDKLKALIDSLESNLEMLEDMLGIAESDSDESAETQQVTESAKFFTANDMVFKKIEIAKFKVKSL
jgi:HK97 family phage prohead protease